MFLGPLDCPFVWPAALFGVFCFLWGQEEGEEGEEEGRLRLSSRRFHLKMGWVMLYTPVGFLGELYCLGSMFDDTSSTWNVSGESWARLST